VRLRQQKRTNAPGQKSEKGEKNAAFGEKDPSVGGLRSLEIVKKPGRKGRKAPPHERENSLMRQITGGEGGAGQGRKGRTA